MSSQFPMLNFQFPEWAREALPWALAAFGVGFAGATSIHAVLYKRDPRSAVSWLSLMWLVPVLGPVLYLLFGINRIERKALSLRRRRHRIETVQPTLICTEDELRERLGPGHEGLVSLARVGERLLERPLLEGNRIEFYVNGEEAYPAMLAAIDSAERSVTLQVYIFDYDEVGARFADAIGRAVARGCQVRVLLDGVGAYRTLGDSLAAFRKGGAPAAVFLPLRLPIPPRTFHLRNHRKLMVVDGRIGFTGGMNIRKANLVSSGAKILEQDVHFRLEGPVVEHIQEAFVDDWAFQTHEVLLGEPWFLPAQARGPVNARGVPFDPGEKLDTLRTLLAAAVTQARRSIRLVTPYFLPEAALVSAINVAAMRGVEVDVLIPEKTDHSIVDWAMESMFWQFADSGCRIWKTPPPFDHTKLLVVDEAWSFFGSANVDPRSLRLNFEFNVEAFDGELGSRLARLIDGKRERSRRVRAEEVRTKPFPARLRNGVARLFTPYL